MKMMNFKLVQLSVFFKYIMASLNGLMHAITFNDFLKVAIIYQNRFICPLVFLSGIINIQVLDDLHLHGSIITLFIGF